MSFESEIIMSNSQIAHVMKKYIPEKLMNCVKLPPGYEEKELNAEEMVQLMLSNSDNMLRMYGTARELLLNLKTFQNFPLSHRCFGYDPKEPYSTFPIVYENIDGVQFIQKADAFYLLQCVFDRDYFETAELSFLLSQDWNYEKALDMFKALLPKWKEQEYCEFEKELKTFFDSGSGNFRDVHAAIRRLSDLLEGFISTTRVIFSPNEKETNSNCPIVVRLFESHGVQFVMKCELFNAINIRNPDSNQLEYKDFDGKLMTMSFEEVKRNYKDRAGYMKLIECPIERTDHKAVPIMTPTGGYCILATDFLFEMLNELIFTHGIFQKIGTDNRNVLPRFFLQMTDFFSPHHKSVFFVTLKEQDKQKEEMIKFWKQFDNIPAKYVRDVEECGFTVRNLNEELEYLGLTETFPEIQKYAESVYSELFKSKKEEFLRTCDMFKAVEKCLLNCIFKQYPMLHLFLHTQDACHLFPALNCDYCISSNRRYIIITNWKESPQEEDPKNTHLYKTELPDRTQLINNFYGLVNFFLWIFQFFGFRSFSLATKTDFDEAPLKETPKKNSKKSSVVTVEQVVDSGVEKGSEANKDEKDPCIRKTSPEDTKKTSVLGEAPGRKKIASEDIQKSSASEKAPVVKTPSTEDIQNTSPIEKQPAVEINQSKCCTKCLRTSEMCNEAKKELKMIQNRLEKYEKKAKRTDEVEIQMREMEAAMKKMKKELKERELEVKKKQTMIEGLELKVCQLEANETRMRLNEKNHSIYEKEQSELINELTTQLEHQNEKIQLMELEIQQNEYNLKLEIRQKERGFEELRAALSIMSNENESIQRDNRNLRERIASIPEAPPTPTVPESPLEGPTHHRFALLGFQKIKDSLYHKKQLKQAKEMVEKMKSSSDLVEIHQISDYEYYQFEGKLLKYTKEVELNIQKIKETRDVSTVTPLPDSPEFSNRFMNLYWRIINNQSITPSEIEVSDSECFICTEEMASDQETLQCEECKKVTHFECASKWLKIHRSCPHCRREMLDPEEFPNLGQ